MERKIIYTIDTKDAGKNILTFLKQHHYSKNVIVLLKKTENSILVNGKWYYVNQKLQKDDQLIIRIIETAQTTPSGIVPVRLPLSVTYEDEDLLVINKPAHMPIHPSMGHHEHTLANAVAYYAKERSEYYPFRCVNRLDRDTSGLTILAKNPYASCLLNEQMRNRKICRTYYAIASGYTKKQGTIQAPIARKQGTVIERTVDFIHGEYAVTHYETLAQKNGLSFLQLTLETGRTHQIRVHMRYLGHPLIGDFLYTGSCNSDTSWMQRQALHAGKLSFFHPISGQPLSFTAPLPEDMMQFFPIVVS